MKSKDYKPNHAGYLNFRYTFDTLPKGWFASGLRKMEAEAIEENKKYFERLKLARLKHGLSN